MGYLSITVNNKLLQILVIVIFLDTIFGILRALREKKINSTIGIDGIIRKTGMLICILFLLMIDFIIDLDLIGFIPSELKEIMDIGKIGISDLFNLLFIIFEILSILKNMIKCKLPIPKKFQKFLENIMKEFTNEMEVNNNAK